MLLQFRRLTRDETELRDVTIWMPRWVVITKLSCKWSMQILIKIINYSVRMSVTQWCSKHFNIVFSCKVWYVGLHVRLKYETYSFYIASCLIWLTGCCGAILLPIKPRTGVNPFLFYDKCTGFFYVRRHNTRDQRLYVSFEGRSIVALRTQVSWLGLEPTLCWSETPELESDALHR